jgi:hypothetical protein
MSMSQITALFVAAAGFAAITACNIGLASWRETWDGLPRAFWFNLAFLSNMCAFSVGLALRAIAASHQ